MTIPIDPMTPEELRACGERAERATPGPWQHVTANGGSENHIGRVDAAGHFYPTAWTPWQPGEPEQPRRDAGFIAAARTDVPRLLATVAARNAELAHLRAAWAEAQNKVGDLSAVIAEAGIAEGVVPAGWYVSRPHLEASDDPCQRDALGIDGKWKEYIAECHIKAHCFPTLDAAFAALDEHRKRGTR